LKNLKLIFYFKLKFKYFIYFNKTIIRLLFSDFFWCSGDWRHNFKMEFLLSFNNSFSIIFIIIFLLLFIFNYSFTSRSYICKFLKCSSILSNTFVEKVNWFLKKISLLRILQTYSYILNFKTRCGIFNKIQICGNIFKWNISQKTFFVSFFISKNKRFNSKF
jgi:hypothetical protein